jgi:hypothetical protein
MREKGIRGMAGPKGMTMPVRELLDEIPHAGRNQVYEMVRAGVFPIIRVGRKIHLLREPTMRILRGEIPPGERPGRRRDHQVSRSHARRRNARFIGRRQ